MQKRSALWVTGEPFIADLLLLLTGVLNSRSTQTLRIGSREHPVTLDQTITFTECPHHRIADVDSIRIAVSRNFFTYSGEENIVRFSQTNRVPGTGTLFMRSSPGGRINCRTPSVRPVPPIS